MSEITRQLQVAATSLQNGEMLVVNNGKASVREASEALSKAQQLDITRPVVFEELDRDDYRRPLDIEVEAFENKLITLAEMTPAYAHSMVWSKLKDARNKVKTFKDEIKLAELWREKLGELARAFGLPDDHISIDTGGPILHVHPVEVSGETLGPSGHPLHFQIIGNKDERYPYRMGVGRGFEAILPTHIQNTGYGTPAHPEMEQELQAKDAIPSIKIGKYVRFGGSFNPQGSESWVIGDNAWLGQGCYFISQEHPADLPAQLARSRQFTSFPGMNIGSWSWIAKQAQVLYRTQYIGKAAVVASHAKINNWVSDYSLVTDNGHIAFYPEKAFVLDKLGITDTKDVLSLDWRKVEGLWQREYNDWRRETHATDDNIAEALDLVRERPASRVLFMGAEHANLANVVRAATNNPGEYSIRRIDVLTTDSTEVAYTMQSLNSLRNQNTRFRRVESLGDIPIGKFYAEPEYDLVVVDISAKACVEGGREAADIFREAYRLVKHRGLVVATFRDFNRYRQNEITLPQYISTDDLVRATGDNLAIHAHSVVTNLH